MDKVFDQKFLGSQAEAEPWQWPQIGAGGEGSGAEVGAVEEPVAGGVSGGKVPSGS